MQPNGMVHTRASLMHTAQVWPGGIPGTDILGFTVDPMHHQRLRNQETVGGRVRTPGDEEKLMELLKLVGIE